MVYGVCGMLIKAEVCVDDGRMVVAARHAHDGRPHHAIHHMLHHMLQHMLIKRHCYLSALRELSRHAARHDMQQQDMTCSRVVFQCSSRPRPRRGARRGARATPAFSRALSPSNTELSRQVLSSISSKHAEDERSGCGSRRTVSSCPVL